MRNKTVRSKEASEKRTAIFVLHKLLNLILPIGLLLLIRVDLVELSIVVALFSKWRVFVVKPRHMLANIRSNSIDIIVKISTLSFIIQADSLTEQLIWTGWYILWLTIIKTGSSKAWVTLQAVAGHQLGLSAIFLFSNNLSDLSLMILVWIVAQSGARHFISSYEETKGQIISHLWALFVLQLAWVLNNWLLVYVFVPQLIFIVGVVGYSLGSIFDAYKQESLKSSFVRQQTIMTAVILALVVALADWQGNI